MKWSNLKQNTCPKCNKDFMVGLMTRPDLSAVPRSEQVLLHPCGFSIRELRYTQIVSEQVNRFLADEEDSDREE